MWYVINIKADGSAKGNSLFRTKNLGTARTREDQRYVVIAETPELLIRTATPEAINSGYVESQIFFWSAKPPDWFKG